MSSIEKEADKYFSDNALAWQNNAYLNSNYNYSVPLNRLRVIKKILFSKPQIKNILDIGCGGAYLSIELAKLGFTVTALDQSQEMLDLARKDIKKQPDEVQRRISLKYSTVDACDVEEKYDCAIAMGLIGYLENDDKLFQMASQKIKRNGLLIVSFRNHLFNLFSMSFRTLQDVEKGKFSKLTEESDSYYKPVSIEKTLQFLKALNVVTGELLKVPLEYNDEGDKEQIKYTRSIEPRQTTPSEAKATAEKWGFIWEKFVGVHPHFCVPGLNKNLPTEVYNRISDCLIPFEEDEIALLWSSVFIGIFDKV